jgi:hypothetical protein
MQREPGDGQSNVGRGRYCGGGYDYYDIGVEAQSTTVSRLAVYAAASASFCLLGCAEEALGQDVGLHCGRVGDFIHGFMRRWWHNDDHSDWASGDERSFQRVGGGSDIEHRDGLQRG